MTRFNTFSRRDLLKSGALALFATGAGPLPAFVARAAAQARGGRAKVLVTIFQRFGMDGLLAVAPYADARLAALRPHLMLSPPGTGADDARLELGGGYGLHPAFAPLLPFYRDGQLAVIHAAGSPDNTRSHVQAQRWWENGAPGDRRCRDGWINRAAAQLGDEAPLPALAIAAERPRIAYGAAQVATVTGARDLLAVDEAFGARLRALYAERGDADLRASAQQALEVSRLLAAQPESRVAYPSGSSLGAGLRDIARLIRAGVGLRIAFAESRNSPDGKGTWDTHSNAGAMGGPFPRMAADFAASVAAFMADLGPYRDDVVLVTLTDFGRNVVENDRLGADHGRATAMFVLGSDIRGGKVYGQLPERFDREALEDGMDLPVTTDYRAVLSALIAAQLGIEDSAALFPGWRGPALPLVRA